MNRPPLRHFLKGVGGQGQPLCGQAKEESRSPGRKRELLFPREMGGPLPPVLRRQRAIEQLEAGLRINRAVAAMDKPGQLGATAIAVHADFMPAGGGFKLLHGQGGETQGTKGHGRGQTTTDLRVSTEWGLWRL